MCTMPDVFSQAIVKARKQHKCCECGTIIPQGHMYERSAGVWDGTGMTYHTCPSCAEIRKYVSGQMKASMPTEHGPAFGELQSLIREFDIILPDHMDLHAYTNPKTNNSAHVNRQFALDRLYQLYALLLQIHKPTDYQMVSLKEAIFDIEQGRSISKPRFVVEPGWLVIDSKTDTIVKCFRGGSVEANAECEKFNRF